MRGGHLIGFDIPLLLALPNAEDTLELFYMNPAFDKNADWGARLTERK